MSNNPHQFDPITVAKRRSVAARRVGIGTRCACGENRPLALIAGSNPITCAECKRREKGQSPFDAHHVAGKANHCLTIPVPVNDHRAILSEDQYNWPKATRENVHGSPLLAISACIRGVYSVIVNLLKKLLLWIPEFVEALDAFLTVHIGEKWWCSEIYTKFIEGDRS